MDIRPVRNFDIIQPGAKIDAGLSYQQPSQLKIRPLRSLPAEQPRSNHKFLKITGPACALILAGLIFPVHFAFNRSSAETVPALVSTGAFIIEQDTTEYPMLPIEQGLGDRYILVDLSRQVLQAYDHGARVMEAVVSTGSRTHATPKGKFAIRNKATMAFSKVSELYMPFWMAFTKQDGHWLGFHELPEYPDGTKEGAEHLGQPFSGGCVRLGIGEAEQFYNWAQVGDPVLVY